MIERLAQYVAVRSVSGEEAALADMIAAQLAGAGLEVRREGTTSGRKSATPRGRGCC